MPNDMDLVSEPDENSGPAVLGRDPILLPRQRKEAVERGKQAVDKVKETLERD